MGKNFEVGGVRFPLQKGAVINLRISSAKSGGVIYSQRLKSARAELLQGLKGKPKHLFRIELAAYLVKRSRAF